jgi:hypothetical protein
MMRTLSVLMGVPTYVLVTTAAVRLLLCGAWFS